MASDLRPIRFHRRGDLLRGGWTDRRLARAVAEGRLLKPRPNAYLPPDAPLDAVDALAVGGRLACVSELARLGVFVLTHDRLHVHLHQNRTRTPKLARRVHRHWGFLRRRPPACAASVDAFDAIIQAVRCQPPRAALATLDSALHHGVLHRDDLDELFAALPKRHAVLRTLIDARAEAGTETLVRLMLRTVGASFEIQVKIRGVGRVDFLVDGWLIVECDSRQFHSTWDHQRRDRRRDQAAAALGYATFRPIAEDILWNPEVVQAALSGLLRHRRRRAVKRTGSIDFTTR